MMQSIAVLGTGRMGYPLVLRLISEGYDLKVFNRTFEKAASLSELGAQVTQSPGEAMREVELIIMAVSAADAANVLLDQVGDLSNLDGRVLMVLSTMSSEETLALRARAEDAGMIYLETPVMGGPSEVLNGSLTIMVGADEQSWQEWKPFLTRLAEHVHWTGPVGSASVLKLALNQFMASSVTALSTSIALVQSANVPVEMLMEILRPFPYYAASYDSKLPLLLSGQYADPKFTIDMMGKDVRLMVEEARQRGIYSATLQSIHELYQASSAAGRGEQDYSAIFQIVKPEGEG